MRRLGWVVTILGALLVLTGLVAAVLLGPDSRFTTGPHAVDTTGTVVVTQPGVITWRGLQVDVLAEVPVNKPVFVGLGNSVDVQDYVSRSERIEVTSFGTPWDVETTAEDGQDGLPGAPTALDWWIADSAGLGGASISTTLPDETVSLAIVAVGATNLSGLEVTLAYGVRGGFTASIAVVLLGTGALIGGWSLRRGDSLIAARDDDLEVVEEIVYVYVDDDGVEHEITAEEAAALEADDAPGPPSPGDATGEDAGGEVQREAVPSARPEGRPPAVEGVVTAGDIVREQGGEVPPDRADAASEVSPAPEPSPTPAADAAAAHEPVVYVFVDEDGVEHEVSEDELGDYELVEDDDEDEGGRP